MEQTKSKISRIIAGNISKVHAKCSGEYLSMHTSKEQKKILEEGHDNTVTIQSGTLYSIGNNATAILPNDNCQLLSTGDNLTATLAGNYITACVNGNNSVITISGNTCELLNTGMNNRIVVTGHSAGIATEQPTEIILVGNSTAIEAEKPCTVVLMGNSCKIKLPKGSVIEYDRTVHTVGYEWGLRPNVWYAISNGHVRKLERREIK